MTYSEIVKSKLTEIIKEMQQSPELFVKNPGKDFTRNRKLSFDQMINLILSMGGNSLNIELLKHFDYDIETSSASAFVQQRDKLIPFTFEFLLHEFTSSFVDLKTYESYRLLAVDGSTLNIAHNPKDVDTYFDSKAGATAKGFNQLHLNAMYDLCNKIYVDALVQPGRKLNEFRALTDMVDRSDIVGNVILLADRGYESYNVFAHLEQKGWNYAVRVKDIGSNGILASLKLPSSEEFDTIVNLTLTRKQTNEVKSRPDLFKRLPNNSTFDYLDLCENPFYPISFRVVRFKLSDDSYETLITNLDRFSFPLMKMKELYHLRWGIETSFRELKHTLGLDCFHSKKTDYISQEIFARLTMYNFCELITMNVVVTQKDTKHIYQVNFTAAIHICIRFFKSRNDIDPPDVEALILKFILPVRPGRSDPRKVKSRSVVSFNYRVA